MTKTQVDLLYDNLNNLLEDICSFLAREAQSGRMSTKARNEAKKLINRSKLQLQEIAKVTHLDNDDRYVDMQGKKEELEIPEDDDIYASLEEIQQEETATGTVCPYMDLPARKMSRKIKYGFLTWKTKIIFKIEKNTQIFAGIHNGYLLIYSCEKDNKPSHTFNLKTYKAEVCENTSKEIRSFNLFLDDNSKLIQFTALTNEDMLEWVSAIRSCITHPHTDDEDDDEGKRRTNNKKTKIKKVPTPTCPPVVDRKTSKIQQRPVPNIPRTVLTENHSETKYSSIRSSLAESCDENYDFIMYNSSTNENKEPKCNASENVTFDKIQKTPSNSIILRMYDSVQSSETAVTTDDLQQPSGFLFKKSTLSSAIKRFAFTTSTKNLCDIRKVRNAKCASLDVKNIELNGCSESWSEKLDEYDAIQSVDEEEQASVTITNLNVEPELPIYDALQETETDSSVPDHKEEMPIYDILQSILEEKSTDKEFSACEFNVSYAEDESPVYDILQCNNKNNDENEIQTTNYIEVPSKPTLYDDVSQADTVCSPCEQNMKTKTVKNGGAPSFLQEKPLNLLKNNMLVSTQKQTATTNFGNTLSSPVSFLYRTSKK